MACESDSIMKKKKKYKRVTTESWPFFVVVVVIRRFVVVDLFQKGSARARARIVLAVRTVAFAVPSPVVPL